ncbi:MAG: helix-turn-helix domain-containing protein [Rhodospirillaceae bacterium]
MLAVLVTLKRHADFASGEAFPSQATIARKLGRSRPWVNRVIAELAEQLLVVNRVAISRKVVKSRAHTP